MTPRSSRSSRASHFVSLTAFVWSLGSSVAAHAQEAKAPSDKVENLVITAERRVENLQTSAVAATVLTGEDLIDKSVYGLTSLQYAAPNVTITDYGSANVFNVRGIGRSQVDVDLPSGVVIYSDGAPTLTGYFQNEPFFDMQSVELLRGPQGTFGGKSAAGGALFIRTKSAELGKTYGDVLLGGGDYDQRELSGMANVALGDTVAARVAYHRFKRGNFYDALGGNYSGHPGEQDLESVRISGRWQPDDQTDVVLKTDIAHLDFGGNVTTSYGHDLFKNIDQNANFKYTDRSTRTVLDAKYRLTNGMTVTSLTGYQSVITYNNLDLNATQPQFYVFNSHGDVTIASQEFNLISPDEGRLRWVVGAFGQHQHVDIPTWQKQGFTFTGFVFAPNFPWATSPWDQQTEDYAGFAHVAYDITDSLELQTGVRYSYYKMKQYTKWTFGFGTTPPVIPWPFSNPPASLNGDSQDINEHSTDWKVSLNWTVAADQFVYGLVSRGHVTGGVNLFPPFFPYDEMEVINYETGWKANWFEDRLHTQFDIYYESFDNYQALFAEAGTGPQNVSTFRNATGDSEIYGAELSGQAVFGNLSFDFAAAYLDSELGTFKNIVNPYPPGGIVDLSGAHSPFSPKYSGNVGVQYAIHLAGLVLTPRVDYAYIDETQAGLFDSQLITLEERKLTNVQLRLEPENGKWWVNAWMTNATDEEYAGGIQNNGTLRYAAPPQMYGVRVGMSFEG